MKMDELGRRMADAVKEAHAGPSDDERIRDAIRFYTERVSWSSADRKPGGERDQFNRLLEEYNRKVFKANAR